MKAFGINDRNPVQPELDYIEKWLGTYDFTLDLVLEACRRTMDRLHKPNFDYADKILQSWSEKKVHTLADGGTTGSGTSRRRTVPEKKPFRCQGNRIHQFPAA